MEGGRERENGEGERMEGGSKGGKEEEREYERRA